MSEQLVSVVVPAFNEGAVLEEFHRRATAALSAIPDADYELIYVDDGSTDDTFAKLRAMIKFARNFGHQVAITAGIDHAKGDAVVVIDADLQDPPEVIALFVEKWREGFDVVYGERASREGESAFKLWTASLFYRLLNRVTKIRIPLDVGDFRLMSRRATDEFRKLREQDRFVRGLVSWIGFRQTGVGYEREARFAGETKYPFRKMLKFAFDGITSFSNVPLRVASWLGYVAAGIAFVYLVTLPIQKLIPGFTVPGFSTTVGAILFLGGIQLICLGIIGEYIGRIFNELKGRPLYIVETHRPSATAAERSTTEPPSD
jgi:dolichol-phosphate mannosyltransferase